MKQSTSAPSSSRALAKTTSSSTSGTDNNHQRRLILSEENYTSTLDKIITRDYYPAIPSLHRDLSVLQKRSEGDTAGAIAIRRAARKLESIEEQKKQDEEQEEEEALLHHGGVRIRPRPLERESVDGFHSRVTSEDNAYFEENMVKEAKEKREKMSIIYGTSNATMAGKAKVQQLLQNYAANGTLAIANDNDHHQRKLYDDSPFQSASDQFNAPVQRIQAAGTTKDGQSISQTNSLFFTPQHQHNNKNSNSQQSSNSSTGTATALLLSNGENDTRMMPPPPARPARKRKSHSNENHTNEKALILAPSSSTENPELNDNRHQLVEYLVKPKSRELLASSSSSMITTPNEKQIISENTRFEYQNKTRIVATSTTPSTPASITIIPNSNQRNNHGNHSSSCYETDSSMNTDLDAPLRPIHEERTARMRQIQKERNMLVAMTPTIIPGRKRCVDVEGGGNDEDDESDSPIITWGQIASTPLVASGESLDQMNPGTTSYSSSSNTDMLDECNPDNMTFKLPSVDNREKVARKVEAKLAKQKQRFEEAGGDVHLMSHANKLKKDTNEVTNGSYIGCRNGKRLLSSSSSSMIQREESLTPAARSLLDRSMKGLGRQSLSSSLHAKKSSMKVNARSNSALGSALRSSYTPKLKRTPKSSRRDSSSSTSSLLHRATPLSSRKPISATSSIHGNHSSRLLQSDEKKKNSSCSLTSGLLNL